METTRPASCCEVKQSPSGWKFLRKGLTDRVVLAFLLIVLLLLVADPGQFPESLVFLAESLIWIAPFLVLALAFAGYAKASGFDRLVAQSFSGRSLRTIVAAALMGALSPFCSCGVIPLIIGLLGAGVPLAPVMAFWIASPIMDPEMFILTAAGISLDFAIAKTIAALGMGLMAGLVMWHFENKGSFRNPLRAGTGSGCGTGLSDHRDKIGWAIWNEQARRQVFWAEFGGTGWFLLKWLALAFLLESLMVAYLEPDWVAGIVGPENPFAVPISALIGMPSYLNGYAAIPTVGGLMDLGMSQGAALAFMTAGAVSSIPAAIAVFAAVRKPVFLLYLFLGLTGSILAGYLMAAAT
jgi:uncharacterized membrane protein YraQ (UPF0718 family)